MLCVKTTRCSFSPTKISMIWRVIYLKGKEVKQSLYGLELDTAASVEEYWQREFNPATGLIWKTRPFEFVAAYEYRAVPESQISAVRLSVYSKKKGRWHFDKSPYAAFLLPYELDYMFEDKPLGAVLLTEAGVIVVAERVVDVPAQYPLKHKPWVPCLDYAPNTHFPQFGDGTIWQLEANGKFWLAEMVSPFEDGIIKMSFWPVQTQEFFLTLTLDAYEKACAGEYVQAFYCHKDLWAVSIRRCVGSPALIINGEPQRFDSDLSAWLAQNQDQVKYLLEC